MRGKLIVPSVLFLLTAAAPLLAEPTTSPADELTLTVDPPPAPDSIDQKLEDAAERPAGILKYGPVSLIDPLWKDMNAKLDDVGLTGSAALVGDRGVAEDVVRRRHPHTSRQRASTSLARLR